MTDEELKAICKAGNLHPSNKVMDIVRKIVRATKEEDARICEEERVEESTLGEISDAQFNLALEFAASAIRASK